ncbi:hypothetical protein [Lederbergia citri]|uniref:Uncharacterized protein n=1 Tax=Lederbergia citri TaxID=2833580 RepID=A0A942T9B8_9BACI|nr:hypothetical protein [Lederbergia citri]MBS4193568.1 hypothetical protein [Lederbergia citri]
MWHWIIYISIPFIAFAIIEELIYLIVNLSIFRTKKHPEKLKDIGE